jgi:hypothetical protein
MTDNRNNIAPPSRVLASLRELIGALDRRVPHDERPSEIQIARDSQTLRRQAVALIEKIMSAESDDKRYDQELVEAIMTDDGANPKRG